MLQLPEPVSLPLSELWICLFDDYDVWQVNVGLGVGLELLNNALIQIIGQHSVVEIEHVSKMGIDDICFIIYSEVFLPCHFNLDLSELVSNCCS
jgi:hypothetical protein